ncbi:hypothetical protein YPPY54_2950, partial [Yersinia pestis PY-54]
MDGTISVKLFYLLDFSFWIANGEIKFARYREFRLA